jgi:hypothetical protein
MNCIKINDMKKYFIVFSFLLTLVITSCKREGDIEKKYKRVNDSHIISKIEEERLFKVMFLEKYDFFRNIFVHNVYVEELIQRDYFSRKEFRVNNNDYFFEVIGDDEIADAYIYRFLNGKKIIIYKMKDALSHIAGCSSSFFFSYTWLEQKNEKSMVTLYTLSFSDYFSEHYYQKVELVFKDIYTVTPSIMMSENSVETSNDINNVNFNNTYKFKYEVLNSFSENIIETNFEKSIIW